MTYPDKCSGMGGLLAQMHLLEFHCCSREVQTLAEDHKVSDRLCIPQANYQRPWGEMKQVDLKQIRIGTSPGPGKEKEDWWASLLRVAWSTARMGEIHNPAPRDSTLSRVSLCSAELVSQQQLQDRGGTLAHSDMLAHRSTGLRPLQSGKGQPELTAKEDGRPVPLVLPLKYKHCLLDSLLSLRYGHFWALWGPFSYKEVPCWPISPACPLLGITLWKKCQPQICSRKFWPLLPGMEWGVSLPSAMHFLIWLSVHKKHSLVTQNINTK